MSNNKKVYLAKSTLASGLDVEYVKSNLLRIPGIEIVEYMSGFPPEECVCVVIVPSADDVVTFENSEDYSFHKISINKNINNVIRAVMKKEGTEDITNISNILVYTGKSDEVDESDCEETAATFAYINKIKDGDINDFENYAKIKIELDFSFLLEQVEEYVDSGYDEWLTKPRHYVPEAKYALPVLEKKSSKGSRDYVVEEPFDYVQSYAKLKTNLLLLRRRK